MFNFWSKFNKDQLSRIYLDTAATTPLDQGVLLAMQPYLTSAFGNPSSFHEEGRVAKEAVEKARSLIKKNLHINSGQIIFTSGGTEANNLALLGAAKNYLDENKKPGVVICSAIEHHSVLDVLKSLESDGFKLITIGVNSDGSLNLKELKEVLSGHDDIALISMHYANNEIGTIFPIKELSKIIRKKRKDNKQKWPLFHVDACQAPRFLNLDISKLGVDLLSLNASKIYGPKGVGMFYVGPLVVIEPIMFGGGQEFGLRSGTENVAGIVGLAFALDLSLKNQDREWNQVAVLRDYLQQSILDKIPNVLCHGTEGERLPHNLNVTFTGVDSELIAVELDIKGFAVSVGSACASNGKNDSHVLKALYGAVVPIESSVRFTLDYKITRKNIDSLVTVLVEIIDRQRSV
jgi:cysteine desulfurase